MDDGIEPEGQIHFIPMFKAFVGTRLMTMVLVSLMRKNLLIFIKYKLRIRRLIHLFASVGF